MAKKERSLATLNADRAEYVLFDERVGQLKWTAARKLTAKDAVEQALALWRQIPGDTADEVRANAEWAIQLIGDAVEEAKKSHPRRDRQRGAG